MPNERMWALLLKRGETPGKLADAVNVDPKTVERRVTKGRIPYRVHRYAVAAFLPPFTARFGGSRDVWEHLFSSAQRELSVLVYAGLFLSEDAGVQRIIKSMPETAGADLARGP